MVRSRVVERVDTPEWTRERIVFDVEGKSVPAYLYLPKRFRPPLQVIHFAAADDVGARYITLTHSIELQLAPMIRSGRAVFSVQMEGYLGRPRPPGYTDPDTTQEEYVDEVVAQITEMRRGLDYLATRPEIDHSRIALFALSGGGRTGLFIAGLESRYRSVVLAGTGIHNREREYAPAASRINFVRHIKAPKLVLQGRHDESLSLKTEVMPMFELLTEPKHLEVYEGGHIAPLSLAVPVITKWLDQTMGPVQ